MKLLDINFYLHLIDKLFRRPQAERGFIDYEPSGDDEIHEEDKEFVLGNIKKILNPEGDWRAFRPTGEKQKRNGNETMSCVSQSAANAIEIIVLKFNQLVQDGQATQEQKDIVDVFEHYGILKNGNCNISDRYIARMSGTTRRGNSQTDAIRKYGFMAEEHWGWVDGWSNYYKAVPQEVIDRGKKLLECIEINYEWARPSIVKNSITYAPLQVGVYAWGGVMIQSGDSEPSYYRVKYQRNHATIRDFVDASGFYIFDSYEPFDKKTTRDFNFGFDMLFTIHLKKKLTKFNQKKIDELINKGTEYILLVEDYDVYKRGLWKLTSDGMIKIEAKDVPETARNDAFIVKSAEDGKLIPYAPVNFKDLVS